MANSKLSALTAATPAGADLVYFVQGGNSRRGTASAIAALATKATVGLSNVDNTSDANKPISTATQAALDAKATAGAIGSSGLTMTAGVLGQTGAGAPLVLSLSGLMIVNGVLTVTASGSGTVTSVGMSVPTGLSVTGSPITTTGTLALAFAAGYSLPLTASQASWDAAAALAATAVQPAGLTSYVQTSDARLSDSREWSATTISQAEAEAGTATTRRAFTALRVFQAVAAWWAATASATGQALATAASAAAARTTLGLGSLATQSGTFSGTSSGTNTGDQDLSGLAVKANNLSDLASASTARANLGLGTTDAPQFSRLGLGVAAATDLELAVGGAVVQLRQTVTAASSVYTLDVTAANEFVTSAAIAGAITINLSNLASIPSGYVWRGVLRFAYTSGTITWFSGNTGYTVKWDGGSAITPTASDQEAVIIEVVGGGSIIEVAALRGRA